MRRLFTALTPIAVGFALSTSGALAQTARTPLSGPATGNTKATAVPRTPWGDPDLQGTYTNSNESGIPMQRPAEFAGKSLDQITPAELTRVMQQRHAQTERTAAVIGGTADNDTGAGPSHWYENYNAKNSRAWMISDPPTARYLR